MTLREKQSIFILNVGKLIQWAFENGYELTIGEGYRTKDQQTLYFKGLTLVETGGHVILAKTSPKSKTMFSKHLDKLAIDLNVFINGELTYEKAKIQKVGDYWESLHPENSWGGNWTSFLDIPHFQMGK